MLPELVIVGHVTLDNIDNSVRLGGAASFAALAAAGMGVRTGVLTSSPSDFELAAPLKNHHCIHFSNKPSKHPTTFSLDYSRQVRKVSLLRRAETILAKDVPVHFKKAPLAYVAPVCGECGHAVIEALQAQHVVVGAQGWLRKFDAQGVVIPALTDEALHVPSQVNNLVFSELDHPDSEKLAKQFAARIPVVALTRGNQGATLFVDGRAHSISPAKAQEQDPTGAGDVFGIVLGLAIHGGASPVDAAHLAAEAAARVVEGPGIGKLETFCHDPDWTRIAHTSFAKTN